MRLLIVGGTGVISYAVVCEALKQGIAVTCINRGISKNQVLPPSVEHIKADYKQKDIVTEKLKGRSFDAVIDFRCMKEDDIDYSVTLFKDFCRQYIFISSCAVYNKGKGDYVCTENSDLINPVWQYSIDKVNCERTLKMLSRKFGLIYTIVRPAVTYGDTRIPYGITPPYGYHGTLIQRILNCKPIILWDNGESYATITHVDDFAVGLVGLLGNPKAYNQAFHIVGDHHYCWKEVIDTLGELLGVEPIYFNMTKEQYAEEIPQRRGELLGGRGISQLLDNSKIKDAVPSFMSTISLKDGIKRTVMFYQSHNYLKGIDWRFDAEMDRIVKKYSKGGIFKTEFVDYLNNASYEDKLIYWCEFHKGSIISSIILLIIRAKKKLRKLVRLKQVCCSIIIPATF